MKQEQSGEAAEYVGSNDGDTELADVARETLSGDRVRVPVVLF